jgi:MFS family permease
VPILPGETRILVPVYFSTMGTWAGYALITVVLPFRFQELGLSVVEYGVALAVYALGLLVTEGLWGYLAFRIGSARYMGGLAVATGLSMLALGFAHSFAAFCVLLGVYGMLVVYAAPLLRWIGMNAAGPGRASRGLGLLGLFFGLGVSVGTAVGPELYLFGGFWLNVYAGTALLAVSTVPLLTVPWKTIALPRTRSTGASSFQALLEHRFILASALVVIYFMVNTLVTNFLQYYSIDLFHGTVDEAGYVIGAARGGSLITGVLLGSVVDRRGAHRTAPIGFLLLATGTIGTWLSWDYTGMVAATMVIAVGAGWLSVTLLPMALSRTLPEHQGTAVGVFGSFEDLGLILGPLLLGAVYASLGPRQVFPIVAGLAMGALLLALVARSSGPPRQGRGADSLGQSQR